MHVCMVSNLYPPETLGGAEKYVRRLAEALDADGHRVSVLTTGATDEVTPWRFLIERQGDVAVHRIAPLNAYPPYRHQDTSRWAKPIQHLVDLWNPQVYAAVRHKLRDIDPDVVHTHNVNGLSNAVFAATDAVASPVVHTLHDYALLHVEPSMFLRGRIREWPTLTKPYRAVTRRAVEPHVDRVLGPSQFVIDKHRERGLFRRTRCTRLPLGIDADGSAGTGCATEKQPPETDEFRVLYAGQLVHQKGVDVLVDAFRQFENADSYLDVLGKGPRRAALERRAADDDRIRFRGFVPEAELERLYAAADVTVVPSRWYDNSPMVIYESYARGTPVIGSRIGGIPELIEEGRTGHLFAPEDVADLTARLRDASRTPRSAYADAIGRKRDDLAFSSVLDRLYSIYREERRNPAPATP